LGHYNHSWIALAGVYSQYNIQQQQQPNSQQLQSSQGLLTTAYNIRQRYAMMSLLPRQQHIQQQAGTDLSPANRSDAKISSLYPTKHVTTPLARDRNFSKMVPTIGCNDQDPGRESPIDIDDVVTDNVHISKEQLVANRRKCFTNFTIDSILEKQTESEMEEADEGVSDEIQPDDC
jgi:hypothetical protein